LTIESDPPGATVFLGAEKLGQTPYTHNTVKSETPLSFRFEKTGYEPRTKEITPRAAQGVSVALTPLPSAKPPADTTRRRPPRPPPREQPTDPRRPPAEDDLLAPQ